MFQKYSSLLYVFTVVVRPSPCVILSKLSIVLFQQLLFYWYTRRNGDRLYTFLSLLHNRIEFLVPCELL